VVQVDQRHAALGLLGAAGEGFGSTAALTALTALELSSAGMFWNGMMA
jgi:hypothetical protein